MQTGNDVKYFLSDHLGSTNGLTDASGNLTASTSYDSFGNAGNANFPTRYQYTGREFDNFTGLYHYRARNYDAKVGRFISEDPIGLSGGINQYGYVSGNPINRVDPTGNFPSKYGWRRFGWKAHQEITDIALDGMASPSQIATLADEQGIFDAAVQDTEYSPMHAMARPGQTPQQARDEANIFIRNEICTARRLKGLGLENEALRRLSRAMHALQDSTAPPHFDFQVWDASKGVFGNRSHYSSEAEVPAEKAYLAQRLTRNAWDYYKSEYSLPSDFFVNNYYDSPNGIVFSPSSTSMSGGGLACGCN